MSDRIILHADLNAFYASVECLLRPELKEVPMAVVAGLEENRHGVILAKNEAAKKYGVKTAELISQAKRKCPGLQTVLPHHDLYWEYSRQVKAVYVRFTDQVESFSIDECWMDVTDIPSIHGNEERFADALRDAVRSETGLTISVGVSWNKVFSKLGSDLKKPDATTMITRDNFKGKVWPLPASDLLLVGRVTSDTLNQNGVHTIGDIAAADPEFLQRVLGNLGMKLWTYANGLDTSPVALVTNKEEYRTLGRSITTPRDVASEEEAKEYIFLLSEDVAQGLQDNNFKCRTMQITLKDTEFHTINRQGKLNMPTNKTAVITGKAMELLHHNYSFRIPLRLIGVTAGNLLDLSEGEQLTLFD